MRLPRATARIVFAGLSFCFVAASSQGPLADASQARQNFFRSFSASSLIGKPVTNSEWERVARVEQVMIDPKDGRVTFVVLSFVDREGSLAIPWSALMVQERGQLHLPKDVAQLENTVHLHESPLSRTGSAGDDGPISEFVPEYDRPLDDQPETWLAQNEPGVLVGLVVGIVTAPLRGEDPVVLLLLDTGLQQVPVALGLKRDLEAARLSVTPGEQVRVYGSRSTVQGRDLFRAKEIQIGAQTLELGTLFPDAQSN